MSVLCNSLSEMPKCLSTESNPDDLLLNCLKDVVLSHSCLFMLFGWSGTANISHDISRFSILNHTYADNMESSDNYDQGTCATKRSTEWQLLTRSHLCFHIDHLLGEYPFLHRRFSLFMNEMIMWKVNKILGSDKFTAALPYSLSHKAPYRQIPPCITTVKYEFRVINEIRSLGHLTGVSAAMLSMRLPNFRAM